ncbi:hypothetical protein QBC35DRAFT_437469 [Podospora australis]|uniref:Uncharacterized protein n=1 Tax=Podospora australis TaxID=1536484 RepID=A0AAN6WQV9_9PEZI|nr:hypothetical protein QBC35DRAFT_437469 [Podospora australis]
MQLSITAILLALTASVSAVSLEQPGVVARQNQNRPVPNGTCCVANTNLKQDACNVNGQQGRCVPGGNNCGSRLSCIANSQLTCNNNVIERGKSLCRARAPGGGLFDGARIIQNLNQATVN